MPWIVTCRVREGADEKEATQRSTTFSPSEMLYQSSQWTFSIAIWVNSWRWRILMIRTRNLDSSFRENQGFFLSRSMGNFVRKRAFLTGPWLLHVSAYVKRRWKTEGVLMSLILQPTQQHQTSTWQILNCTILTYKRYALAADVALR